MFSTALKDYVEQLSYLTSSSSIGLFSFVGGTVNYVFHSIVFILRYFITFQWLFGFQELPTIFRQSYHAIFEGKNLLQQGLLEPNFYPILNQGLESKHLITGLLNGCFLAFPCTIPQMLGFRALIVNGWPMATVYILGAVTGQALFWFCVLFGFDFVLTPILDFHPIMLIVGAVLVVNVIWDTTKNPNFEKVDYDLRDFKHFSPELKQQLIKIFRSNVALAWFENQCLGRYIGNLTFDTTSSVLQTGDHWWLVNTFGYWLGLAVGMALWSAVFGWAWIRIYNRLTYLWPKLSLPQLKIRYHYFTTVALLTMAFNTVPYYGLDYLVTGPLGFIYQDRITHVNSFNNIPGQDYHVAPGLDSLDDLPYYTDVVPFDDDTVTFFEDGHALSTSDVTIETTHMPSEREWANRLLTRNKYVERSHTASGIHDSEFKRQFYGVDVAYPTYPATGVEIPDEDGEAEELEIVRESNYLNVLAQHLFREDAYYPAIDSETAETEWKPLIATQRVFRSRVLTNPVYKTLLRMDVLPFLGGQPGFHHVSLDDDVNLYEQRTILNNYLTSVENYKRNTRHRDFAFPKHVYNQQFKGSLNIISQYDAVRVVYPDRNRLDTVMMDEEANELVEFMESETDPIDTKVLSYDQTLYNQWQDDALSVLHEELRPLLDDKERNFKARRTDSAATHVVNYESGPLYFGWDASLHKLLINTSRLPVPGHDMVTLNETEPIPPYFTFQAWPQNIHDEFRHYRFFDLNIQSDAQIEKLKYLLGFVDDEDLSLTVADDFKHGMLEEMEEDAPLDEALDTAESQKQFFSSLPQYDWAWIRLILEAEDRPQCEFIEIGHALPPKIDGVAWPGILDNRLITQFKSRPNP